ncbi:MAG TPA: hypothetical protein VFP95_03155 [Gammaproteobacteria bacterium]|nr:hypothetical protein [Gammaproteobacteria bacterium]
MIFIATLLTSLGLLLLWQAWRTGRNKYKQQQISYRIAGWVTLFVSMIPWMMAGGNDRGVALGITFLLVLALAGVLLLGWRDTRRQRPRKKPKPAIEKSITARDESAKALPLFARRSCTFLLAGPVAFFVALLLGINLFALAEYLGWSLANQVAAAFLFVPFAWALLSVWATYDTRLRYRSSVLIGLLLLSSLVSVVGGVILPGVV